MAIHFQTIPPHDPVPKNTILPHQIHETTIKEIITGKENLANCDGLWTCDPQFRLGIRTADCAPIVFWDREKFGIIHAGWRGLVDGICEKMLGIFNGSGSQIFVGPILPRFQVQRDGCYERIRSRFGGAFFSEAGTSLFFDFKAAVQYILPTAKFDPRSTFEDLQLASWRRDKDVRRNVTVVGKKEINRKWK